jgi:hypothetical protein
VSSSRLGVVQGYFVGALHGWICVVTSPVDIHAVSVVGSVDVDR